ncbi:MAG: hypothetical protein JNM66_01770 [Bryobacterales bacterium]|nr:hypothetical protein [Bryobacterales bacterium]
MLLLAAALTVIETLTIPANLHHVQGIDVEGDTLWVSSVDKEAKKGFLYKLHRPTGHILAQAEVHDGDKFHPGGLTLDGDDLWLPVAEYRRASTTQIQRRDKRTLRLLAKFDVNDHIGCIAASSNRLYGGNWDSREIYEWSKTGRHLSKRANDTGTRYQDMKFINNQLVAAGLRAKGKGAIDWLDPKSLQTVRREELETTDRGVVFTNEGMTLRDGKIYLLPEDFPSRLFTLNWCQAPI